MEFKAPKGFGGPTDVWIFTKERGLKDVAY